MAHTTTVDLDTSLDTWLCKYVPTGQKVFVATAFFDEASVAKLLHYAVGDAASPARTLRVVVGVDRATSVRALQRLLNAQDAYPKHVCVRCIGRGSGGLFHWKLYSSQSTDRIEAAMGSGNLTTAAAEANDELYCYLTMSPESGLSAKLNAVMDRCWESSSALTQNLIDLFGREGRIPIGPLRSKNPFEKAFDALDRTRVVAADLKTPSLRVRLPRGLVEDRARIPEGRTIVIETQTAGFVKLLPNEVVRKLEGIERSVSNGIQRYALVEHRPGQFLVPRAEIATLKVGVEKLAVEHARILSANLSPRKLQIQLKQARAELEEILNGRDFPTEEARREMQDALNDVIKEAEASAGTLLGSLLGGGSEIIRIDPHPAVVRYALPDNASAAPGRSRDQELVDALITLLQKQIDPIEGALRLLQRPARRAAVQRARKLQVVQRTASEQLLRMTTVARKTKRLNQRAAFRKCQVRIEAAAADHRAALGALRQANPLEALQTIWGELGYDAV